MASASKSLLLTDLSWTDVHAHLANDARLIVPIGACDQYGPHLPIGAASRIAEAFARHLSEEVQVMRAPTMDFGVNAPTERVYPGPASLRQKTLHTVLNDLLASWEDSGFQEFILLTVHDYDSHVEAIATVTGTLARVRVIEALNLDLSGLLAGSSGPEHGGEIMTSLMLHLYPEAVRMERAANCLPSDRATSTLRRLPPIPARSAGCVGQPTLATAERGRRLYEYIYEKIRARVFLETD